MALKGIPKAYMHQLVSEINQPAIKKYKIADGEGDITDVYYADANAVASGICIRQHFEYATVSGFKYIQGEEWFTSAWDIAWDMTEPS